ncbi:hypothetical protein O3M35_004076 [Rhynocoris fuscipes]|uniref:Uncharacterized protein n=1 Tax=Rhynocoris fuscipes TaxID=488301 RepID=A0AAW1CIG1_9HEMI
MDEINSGFNMPSTSDESRNRKMFTLYNTIEDFTFSMPGGWDDYSISIFVEACHRFVEDLRNYKGDFMRQWSRIVDYGISVTNNINCFNITVTMELAKVLKSYLLKNSTINEYMENKFFRDLFYATEDLLQYFPNPSQKSPLQKCDCLPKLKQSQSRTSITKPESLSDIIKGVSKQYYHLFGAKGIPSSILWSEMTQKVSEKTGLKVDVKQFLESVKINITKDIMKESSIEDRGMKFLSVAKDYLPIFDYIPPRNIKKNEFLPSHLLVSNATSIGKYDVNNCLRAISPTLGLNPVLNDYIVDEDVGAYLEVPYEEVETIVIDSDSDDYEGASAAKVADQRETDEYNCDEVDAISSIVGSCNESKAVVVERIENDPLAIIRAYRDTDHSYEMVLPTGNSPDVQTTEIIDNYIDNDNNSPPHNDDLLNLTDTVPNKSQPLKDFYSDNFDIDKQTLDIYLDSSTDADIQNSLKTLTSSLDASLIDENKTAVDYTNPDPIDITLGNIEQEIFPLEYSAKQISSNQQNIIKDAPSKNLLSSPISVSSPASGDSIPEGLCTRSLDNSPLRLSSPIAKFLIEDIQRADDEFSFFPSPVKESTDLYKIKSTKQPERDDSSTCPELNSFDRIDSVLRELEECEKKDKEKELNLSQSSSSYVQHSNVVTDNLNIPPVDTSSSKVLNINVNRSCDGDENNRSNSENADSEVNVEAATPFESAITPAIAVTDNSDNSQYHSTISQSEYCTDSLLDNENYECSFDDINTSVEEETNTSISKRNEFVESIRNDESEENDEINVVCDEVDKIYETDIDEDKQLSDENSSSEREEDSNVYDSLYEGEIILEDSYMEADTEIEVTTEISECITKPLLSEPKLRYFLRKRSKSEDNIIYKLYNSEELNEKENSISVSKSNASTCTVDNEDNEEKEESDTTSDLVSYSTSEQLVITEQHYYNDYYNCDYERTGLYSPEPDRNLLNENIISDTDNLQSNCNFTTVRFFNNIEKSTQTISNVDIKRKYKMSVLDISEKITKRSLISERLLNSRRFLKAFDEVSRNLCDICNTSKYLEKNSITSKATEKGINQLKRLNDNNIEELDSVIGARKKRRILEVHSHDDENLNCHVFHGFRSCCEEFALNRLEFIKNECSNSIDFSRSDNCGWYEEDGEVYLLKKAVVLVKDFVKEAVQRLLNKENRKKTATNSRCNCNTDTDNIATADFSKADPLLRNSEDESVNLTEQIGTRSSNNQQNVCNRSVSSEHHIDTDEQPEQEFDSVIDLVDTLKEYARFEDKASSFTLRNCPVKHQSSKKKKLKFFIEFIKNLYEKSYWNNAYKLATKTCECQIVPLVPDVIIDDKEENELAFSETIDVYESDEDDYNNTESINTSNSTKKHRYKNKSDKLSQFEKRILNDSSNLSKKKSCKKSSQIKKPSKKCSKRKENEIKYTVEDINNFFDSTFDELSSSQTLKDLFESEGEYDFGFDVCRRRRRKLPAWYNKFREEYQKHIEWKQQLSWKMETEITEIEKNKLLILEKITTLLKSKVNDL